MTNNAATKSAFERGVTEHRAGRLHEASERYREALRHHAEHEQARFLFAAVAIELGRHDEAIEALERLLKRAPGNAVYWTNLGEALSRSGNNEGAANALVNAVRLKPDLAQAHFNLGLVTSKLGETESAVQAFERATDLKPDDAQMQHGLARRWPRRLAPVSLSLSSRSVGTNRAPAWSSSVASTKGSTAPSER